MSNQLGFIVKVDDATAAEADALADEVHTAVQAIANDLGIRAVVHVVADIETQKTG